MGSKETLTDVERTLMQMVSARIQSMAIELSQRVPNLSLNIL
jgi:hypothetical protein